MNSHIVESYLQSRKLLSSLGVLQAEYLANKVVDLPSQELAKTFLLLLLYWHEKGAAGVSVYQLIYPLNREMLDLQRNDIHQEWDIAWDALDESYVDDLLQKFERMHLNLALFNPIVGFVSSPKHHVVVYDQVRNLFRFDRAAHAVYELERKLNTRLQVLSPSTPEMERILHDSLNEAFVNMRVKLHYRQVAACALALRTHFLIIAGGPGTGKTSVLKQVLKVWKKQDSLLYDDQIVLCAPTGRAKSRMAESICTDFPNTSAMTLHSLLSMRPDGSIKYNQSNELPYRIVVVDEASMVDLYMFSALLNALNDATKLVLIGDMNQLPSVDAGAVLGDLTQAFALDANFKSCSKATHEWLQEVFQKVPYDDFGESTNMLVTSEVAAKVNLLVDHTIVLNHTYRSSMGIQELCLLVNQGNAQKSLQLLLENQYPNHLHWQDNLQENNFANSLTAWWRSYGDYELTRDLLHRLNSLSCDQLVNVGKSDLDLIFNNMLKYRILVFTHEGPWGRMSINKHIENLVREMLGIKTKANFNFAGQQVILTMNHKSQNVYNGDLGIFVNTQSGLRVVFQRGSEYIVLVPSLLEGLEPSYAMTVHKSQGSEFEEILLVVPERDTPLLSRQIIYTGISRAKTKAYIWGKLDVLAKGIIRRDERPGGVVLA